MWDWVGCNSKILQVAWKPKVWEIFSVTGEIVKILFVSQSISFPQYRGILEELSKIPDAKVVGITVDWHSKNELLTQKNYELLKGRTIFGPHIYRYFFSRPLLMPVLKFHPDIVFADVEPGSIIALQTFFWAKIAGAKFCFRTYENLFFKRPFPLSVIESFILKNADSAIVGDEMIKDVLRKKGFSKNIFIAELGLSFDVFKKTNQPELKKELGIKNFTISYFGRLNTEKSVETIIEASAYLNFDHQILIDTYLNEPDYLEKLINLAKEKNVFDRIIFVDPKYSQMPAYYNVSDVVVIPSKSTTKWKEQFGRTIIEAMACEVPVVGSDSGSIPFVMGDCGLIFKEQDPKDLAKKISQLYYEKGLRGKLILKGLQRVKENYTWEKIAKKVFLALEETINDQKEERLKNPK